MGLPNATRIETQEGAYSFLSRRLSDLLLEVDQRLNGANVWTTITRSAGLISRVEFFANSSRTIKVIQADITRGAGVGGVLYITQIVKTYYNVDTSLDCTITETLTRPGLGTSDVITATDSVFATSESTII